MHRALVVAAVMVLAVGAITASSRLLTARAGASTDAQPASSFLPTPPFQSPREIVLFGHVRSVSKADGRFVMRVDPAHLLIGSTANRAAVEDKTIPPGSPVPNDYYIRDEGHKVLTFRVAATATVTVVTNRSTEGIRATSIPVSELAQIVKGKNPKHRALFEPKNGFWIRVASDTVRSLDQQYTP